MAEMPHLVQVQEELGGPDFSLLAITDAPAEEMAAFRERHELNFPILSEAVATREAFGIDLIWGSVFYLVDPEGRVVEDGLERSVERVEDELSH